jgi:hypothetical protein
MKLIRSALAALCLVASMLAVPALAQPVFRTDRVITAEEIEPAVAELNRFMLTYAPRHPYRYSSDPSETLAQGFVALRNADRLIALFLSKYVVAGSKIDGVLLVGNARPETFAKAQDMLQVAAYAESGRLEVIDRYNINGVLGNALLLLIERGAKLPDQPSPGGPPNLTVELAQIRAAAGAIERKVGSPQ